MQLDGALGPPEFRPVEHAHRQVDDAPVQAHQFVFETELLPPALAGYQFLAFEQRLLEHRLVQRPRPMLIGIGQRGLLARHRHPQMLQLPLAARQSAANLAQRMGAPQLAEQHGHKLAPTREPPSVPLGFVLLDRLLEIPARKQLQHLRENAAYFVHRLSLLKLNWFLPGTQSSVSGAQPLIGNGTLRFRPSLSSLIWTAMNCFS